MSRVLVLGTGYVVKPMVDYFIDRCKYQVTVASRDNDHSGLIIAGRALGQRVLWSAIPPYEGLNEMVKDVDVVVSMLPPHLHPIIAKACLRHRVSMVTTSYISPEMTALDEEAKEAGVVILSEIGEDPGIDHMGAMTLIDLATSEGGKVVSFTSYGAGIPSFEHNNNPFGYKFSWSPSGLLKAGQTPAVYFKGGKPVRVSGEALLKHSWLVDIEGLGVFETYPNRDSTPFLAEYGLVGIPDFYRGLLRYPGYCNSIQALKDLNFLNNDEGHDLQSMTFRQFSAHLVESDLDGEGDVIEAVANHLDVKVSSDIIKQLMWLGLFDDRAIPFRRGSNADVLLHLMQEKMSYAEHEKDMIIIHNEAIVEFSNRVEKRVQTMKVEGRPFGHSAMSRAVSLPAAIAARMIIEGTVRTKGVHRPVLKEIYKPVLVALEDEGYKFDYRFRII
ncbi:saccharopine dehydrogenase C-terminal domain-containing protein [Planctomycetota bacterium]